MVSDIEAKHIAESWLRKGYRAAVKQLNPKVHLSEHANVQVCESGAFVEVHVWVPKEVGYQVATRMINEDAERKRVLERQRQDQAKREAAQPQPPLQMGGLHRFLK